MGELFGVPEWLTVTFFVVAGVAGWLVYGYRSIRRAHERVLQKRPNPTEPEFLAMMRQDCSSDSAQFLWNQALSYVEPRLTPHPDDNLFFDLKIDDDDVAIDWTREWAKKRGFHASNYPEWPENWPATVRNFGMWLDMAPM